MEMSTRRQSHINLPPPRLDCLPAEVLHCIVAHVQPLPEVPVEHRAWFSSVSLQLPCPPDISNDEERESALSRISRVSRRFRPVVQKHLFKWVVIRFSKEGFDRLEKIAATPHLALLVRRFSYMVRRTYLPDQSRMNAFRRTIHEDPGGKLEWFLDRAGEQLDILQSGRDTTVLRKGIQAFQNLQHIRILQLSDEIDNAFLRHVNRNRDDVEALVQLDWTRPFSRAIGALGHAVASFGGPQLSQWSFRQIDTSRARVLMDRWDPAAASLARRTQCLLLMFKEDLPDELSLDVKMQQISPLFHNFFTASQNLVSIHIGFREDWLGIQLEDIFQNIHLENLKIFSIVGWCLGGEEIIAFARRHRDRLVGIRVGVLLKEGIWWKDVLPVLRGEMPRLRWLSLSKAGYTSDRPVYNNAMDEDHDDASDESEDESIGPLEEHGENSEQHDEGVDADTHSDEDQEGDDNADVESITDSASDIDPAAPGFITFALELEKPYVCTCTNIEHTYLVDGLGDDGHRVTIHQRHMWESWVVGCQVHGKRYLGPNVIQEAP